MSKTEQAMEMFRANPNLTAAEVAQKVGIVKAYAYGIRKKVFGPIYAPKSRKRRVIQFKRPEQAAEAPKLVEKTVPPVEASNILLQAQLNDALRELEDCRAVIRYLEKKINADAV